MCTFVRRALGQHIRRAAQWRGCAGSRCRNVPVTSHWTMIGAVRAAGADRLSRPAGADDTSFTGDTGTIWTPFPWASTVTNGSAEA